MLKRKRGGSHRLKFPKCPYCGNTASHYPSSQPFYRGRNFGPVWACMPCQAWVGCHKGTNRPMGRLANAELRKAKMAAHRRFDPIWQDGHMSRASAYKWLAGALGIPKEQCHIGMFDVEDCDRVRDLSLEKMGELLKRIPAARGARQGMLEVW